VVGGGGDGGRWDGEGGVGQWDGGRHGGGMRKSM